MSETIVTNLKMDQIIIYCKGNNQAKGLADLAKLLGERGRDDYYLHSIVYEWEPDQNKSRLLLMALVEDTR